MAELTMADFKVGDTVRIERDEKKYPSIGSWPKYRKKPGIVVILNEEDEEVGVEVGAVLPRIRSDERGLQYSHEQVAWFKPHELRPRALPQ